MSDKHPDELNPLDPDQEPDTEMYHAMYDPFGADFEANTTSTLCDSKIVYLRDPVGNSRNKLTLTTCCLTLVLQVFIILKLYNFF